MKQQKATRRVSAEFRMRYSGLHTGEAGEIKQVEKCGMWWKQSLVSIAGAQKTISSQLSKFFMVRWGEIIEERLIFKAYRLLWCKYSDYG